MCLELTCAAVNVMQVHPHNQSAGIAVLGVPLAGSWTQSQLGQLLPTHYSRTGHCNVVRSGIICSVGSLVLVLFACVPSVLDRGQPCLI